MNFILSVRNFEALPFNYELTKLEGNIRGVKNYSVAVKEYEDNIIFLRKIVEGGADQSYGIEVAKLAGLPQDVIERAKEILEGLEENSSSKEFKYKCLSCSLTLIIWKKKAFLKNLQIVIF